jgi:hypothetical protein
MRGSEGGGWKSTRCNRYPWQLAGHLPYCTSGSERGMGETASLSMMYGAPVPTLWLLRLGLA